MSAVLADTVEPEIEINRAVQDARAYAAANREAIDAEWAALESPPRTIAEHIRRPL